MKSFKTPITKEMKLKAVNETIEKWIKVKESMDPFFDVIDSQCGFCDTYPCRSDSCPAQKICFESGNNVRDVSFKLLKQIKKNLEWLKHHKMIIEAFKC